MDRPRRDSRQHNGITVRRLSQPTFATKSAKSGREALTRKLSILAEQSNQIGASPLKCGDYRSIFLVMLNGLNFTFPAPVAAVFDWIVDFRDNPAALLVVPVGFIGFADSM
jgi:hypothetical protein